MRIFALDAVHEVVIERRYLAVLLRRETGEPCLARVNHKPIHAGDRAAGNERTQALLRILVVDADAALHRDGYGDVDAHGGNAFGNERGFAQEAGAKAAGLYTARRTADVQIDLVIAEIFGDARGERETRGFGAAELQRHGTFKRIKADQPRAVAADHGFRRDHFGIKPGTAGQQAVEVPAVPVGPFHHRRDAETVGQMIHGAVFCLNAAVDQLPGLLCQFTTRVCPARLCTRPARTSARDRPPLLRRTFRTDRGGRRGRARTRPICPPPRISRRPSPAPRKGVSTRATGGSGTSVRQLWHRSFRVPLRAPETWSPPRCSDRRQGPTRPGAGTAGT